MKRFDKPKVVTDADVAFGGRIDELLPSYDEIPDEFKNRNNPNKFSRVVSRWFFQGLPAETTFITKEGIDLTTAMRHLSTCLGSFAPKHERKEAGVAYLMSLWFEDIKIPDKSLTSKKE